MQPLLILQSLESNTTMQLFEEGTKRDRSRDEMGAVLIKLIFKQDFLSVNAAAATQLL